MNYWNVEFSDEAVKDRDKLDHIQRSQVDKAIRKVSCNPLPKSEGGYGIPLGHLHSKNLTGLCEIKLKRLGIRVIYRIVHYREVMKIIVIAARVDEEVYDIATKRTG